MLINNHVLFTTGSRVRNTKDGDGERGCDEGTRAAAPRPDDYEVRPPEVAL